MVSFQIEAGQPRPGIRMTGRPVPPTSTPNEVGSKAGRAGAAGVAAEAPAAGAAGALDVDDAPHAAANRMETTARVRTRARYAVRRRPGTTERTARAGH
jgi:hypothetical protein